MFRKLFSTRYSAGAFTTAMLLLRLTLGCLMIYHGYSKLIHFADKKDSFMNFLGMGSTITLALVVFAEFFCSLFIMLGLFTRLAAIPLLINMLVILIKINHSNVFGDDEGVALYLSGYIILLLVGPGKISVDAMIGK